MAAAEQSAPFQNRRSPPNSQTSWSRRIGAYDTRRAGYRRWAGFSRSWKPFAFWQGGLKTPYRSGQLPSGFWHAITAFDYDLKLEEGSSNTWSMCTATGATGRQIPASRGRVDLSPPKRSGLQDH